MLNDDSDLLLFCLIPHLMSDPEGESISRIREHGAAKGNARSISPIREHGAAKGNASILAFLLGLWWYFFLCSCASYTV